MRGLKAGISWERERTPLVVKASLPRAFLSLGVFLEMAFLFLGSYLLAVAILQPLQASTSTVLGAGVFLALASVLLFYLVWPTNAKCISRRDNLEDAVHEEPITVPAKRIPDPQETQWLLPKKDPPGPM